MACVLLIVLWVRSYTVTEIFEWSISGSGTVEFRTGGGQAGYVFTGSINVDPFRYTSWPDARPLWNKPWLFLRTSRGDTAIFVPYWGLIVPFSVLATLPWLRQIKPRFSLRTLLIATTLVAVLLGLIVWLTAGK